MRHLRSRYAEFHIKKALKYSSIVGVIGQRQTGKTTLVSQFCDEYRTMDGSGELTLAEANPMTYYREEKNLLSLTNANFVLLFFRFKGPCQNQSKGWTIYSYGFSAIYEP
jgi:GTPase SAR1 family protein